MTDQNINLAGVSIYMVAMLVVTPLTRGFDPPRPLLTSDGEEIKLKDRLGILSG